MLTVVLNKSAARDTMGRLDAPKVHVVPVITSELVRKGSNPLPLAKAMRWMLQLSMLKRAALIEDEVDVKRASQFPAEMHVTKAPWTDTAPKVPESYDMSAWTKKVPPVINVVKAGLVPARKYFAVTVALWNWTLLRVPLELVKTRTEEDDLKTELYAVNEVVVESPAVMANKSDPSVVLVNWL